MTATLSRRQLKIAQRQHARATAPGRELIAVYADAVQPIPSYGAKRDEVLKFRQSLNNLRGVVKAHALSIPSPVHPSGLSRVGRRRAKAQARKAVAQ
jgi:hypothetical protein